ncbi:MAG: hypothetical protein H0W02_05300 [Ktedonobacteraceae bacterium]|nr:hypothetical protein [Ktedonobacteraceae bacterium]
MEDLLREIAFCEDELKKAALMEECARYPDQVLEELLAVLEAGDASLGLLVLQIIQKIDYPANAPTLPYLLLYAGDQRSPLHMPAVQVLAAIGLRILPPLVEMAREDEDIDDALDEALWAVSAYATHEVRQRVISELVSLAQDMLPVLIYVLQHGQKRLWGLAAEVVIAVGYPHNAEALPVLLKRFMDDPIFSYNEDDKTEGALYERLAEALGPEVLVPYLMEILWEQWSPERNRWTSVCIFLHQRAFGPEYSVPCGPAITFLFSQLPQRSQELWGHVLLRFLEKIGPDCASYALPTLLDLVRKDGTSDVAQRAHRLIASFDEQVLAPYAQVLAALQIGL